MSCELRDQAIWFRWFLAGARETLARFSRQSAAGCGTLVASAFPSWDGIGEEHHVTKLDELALSTLTEISALIKARQISPVELTQAMLARIERIDPKLHSYATVTPELALAQAKAAEAELAQGRWRGPMHGIPIGLKDLCFTKGVPTAGGMTIHAGWIAGRGRHRGRAPAARRRRAARQAADDRRRLRRPPSQGRAAAQSVECRALGGRVLVGLRRRHGRRPLLRVDRLGHRRLDPFPVGHERPHRREADLGTRQPARLLRALRFARPSRADDALGGRCRGHARRHRRARRQGSDDAARAGARLPRRPCVGRVRRPRPAHRHRPELQQRRRRAARRRADGEGGRGPGRARRPYRGDHLSRHQRRSRRVGAVLRRRDRARPPGHLSVAQERIRADAARPSSNSGSAPRRSRWPRPSSSATSSRAAWRASSPPWISC